MVFEFVNTGGPARAQLRIGESVADRIPGRDCIIRTPQCCMPNAQGQA
jgi:hypothetical protein